MIQISNFLNRYFLVPQSAFSLGLFRFLFFFFVWFLHGQHERLEWFVSLPLSFWSPEGYMLVFRSPLFDLEVFKILRIVWSASLLMAAFGFLTRVSTIVACALGFLIIGHAQSYGYFTHTYNPLLILLFVFPFSRCGEGFSIDCWIKRNRGLDESRVRFIDWRYGWPIQLARILFCLVFFGAGWSKLTNGGLDWVVTDNLRNHLLKASITFYDNHPYISSLGLNQLLVGAPTLTKVMAFLALALELAAPLALFLKRISVFIVGSLFLMQLGIFLTMFLFFSDFIVIYLSWLPFNWLNMKFNSHK